jgi:hypothetical protein
LIDWGVRGNGPGGVLVCDQQGPPARGRLTGAIAPASEQQSATNQLRQRRDRPTVTEFAEGNEERVASLLIALVLERGENPTHDVLAFPKLSQDATGVFAYFGI